MIHVQDNFLTDEAFKALQEYAENNKFHVMPMGDKEFKVLETPAGLLPNFFIQGHELYISFIRKAHKGFDNDLRIHADNIIAESETTFASVLYLNKSHGVTPNGTAFWHHKTYGLKLPENISNEEFDRLLTEDSNDESKWTQSSYIENVANRLLTYTSNYFHSKFPKEIEEGERIVLVNFFRKKE